MANPTTPRRQFTAQQKSEAVEHCLQQGFTCNAAAEWLGLPSSSLARWVRQARIDRGQAGPLDQGLLTSKKRAELNRLRMDNRELRREKDFFRPAAVLSGVNQVDGPLNHIVVGQAQFATEQLSPRGIA
jgi:transposase-like protein